MSWVVHVSKCFNFKYNNRFQSKLKMAHLSNCVFDKCNGLGGCQIVDQSASSFTSFFDSIKTAVNAKPPRGKKVEDNHQMLDDYLDREFPEISSGQQQEAIFMPDCFITIQRTKKKYWKTW